MKPHWILETPTRFHEEHRDFARTIARHGSDVTITKDPVSLYLHDDDSWAVRLDASLGESTNVLCMGSLGMCDAVKRVRPAWVPGVWDNRRAVSMYAAQHFLTDSMLNRPLFLTWHFVQQHIPQLFASFGPRLFIKPSECSKLFDGSIVDEVGWADFLQHVSSNGRDVPPKTLVAVSPAVPPQALVHEWRFFVDATAVITGCRVRTAGKLDLSPTVEHGAAELAAATAIRMHVDPIFVVDICRVGEVYRVVELGTFSPAGIYCVDQDKLVEAANLWAAHSYAARPTPVRQSAETLAAAGD